MAVSGRGWPVRFRGSGPSRRDSPAPIWFFGTAVSALAALLMLLLSLGPLQSWELATQDMRIRRAPPPPRRAPIVLIGVTPETYEAFSLYPELFWGHLRATALRNAAGQGARVVAFDFLQLRSADDFLRTVDAKLDRFGGAPDQGFSDTVQAVRQHGTHVVLGWSLRSRLLPAEPIRSSGADLGFVDRGPIAEEEAGGVIRHSLLFEPGPNGDGRALAAFPAAIALRMLGKDPSDPTALASLERPYAGGGWPRSFRIHYSGGGVREGKNPFPTYSLEHLVNNQVPSDVLQGAAVLIGPMDDSASDLHRVPAGEAYGIEIQAQAVATLLLDRPLRRLTLIQESSATLLLGLVAVAFHGFRRRMSLAIGLTALGLALALLWGSAEALTPRGWLIPVVGPTGVLLAATLSAYGVRLLDEAQRRILAEQVVVCQLDPKVADDLLQRSAPRGLGGENRTVTVLFTDLRGFTDWADRTENPQELAPLLNRYLGQMVDCIRAEDGTLDKFMGDAVLAFWNAPKDQTDHAARAVRCALAMQKRMDAFNRECISLGHESLRMGVGIQTGLAMAGMVGCKTRMNYTLIGKPVNVAARLESETKKYSGVCEVLIGETSLKEAQRTGQFVPVPERPENLDLKGVSRTVRAYRLITETAERTRAREATSTRGVTPGRPHP